MNHHARSAAVFLCASSLLGACVVESQPAQETTPVAVQEPQQAPQPTAQPIMQPQPTSQAVATQQPTAQATSSGVIPGQSNFGTVALTPGFVPDPHVVSGQSGGQDEASARHTSCRGWIARNPDHLFQANGNFGNLRIIAASSADTTLVVLRPDGTYMCDDDSEGRNPIVGGNFPAGTYAIWVGSYREGQVAPYRLGFTELASVDAATVGGGAQPNGQQLASNFGTVSLSPGFMPDPHLTRGVSGGALDARQMGQQCRGWIANTPDHIFQAAGNFDGLRVLVRSSSDTTLVIADPRGRVWCDDDSEGRNPIVTGAFPAGTYRVWIGSYSQGENARYSLGFTELDSVHTSNLPSP